MFLPEIDDELFSIPPEVDRPRYNIAPTQSLACVGRLEAGGSRQLFFARWGLVPSWADDLSVGNRMINARSETVHTKPSFKRAFGNRRCLIPADGYYEWMKTSDGKQPYLIHRDDDAPFAIAGLWEENRKLTTDGTPIVSCTVLTTQANTVTGAIHDRMPVFLNESDFDVWLDLEFNETRTLLSLLRPADDDGLKTTAVSRQVNSPKHDGPECTQPVQVRPDSPTLFD